MTIQKLTFVIGFVLAVPAQCCVAADSSTAFTNAASAGPDFIIQGEYKGTITTDDGDKQFGAQVIALGDDNFSIVGYFGGLPGDGWKRGDKIVKTETKAESGTLQGIVEGADYELANETISIFADGNQIGKLKKVVRQSPTLGKKPPKSSNVLFDGTSADNFENGELVEEYLLGATNCASKLKLGDHSLHIEFRTPYMPNARGQGRGNSGVYIQGRYELQVLDSFGLDGKNNECGGIYSISEPIVNMCFPPLSWQTYDMDFTAARYDAEGKKIKNARVTVKHNGVVIHNDLELTHGTPGYHQEGPEPDSLFLQNHGNPVAFRNIWVIEK